MPKNSPSKITERITYGFYESILGEMIIAQSAKGVCWIGFMTSRAQGAYKGDGFERMQRYFKNAEFIHDDAVILKVAKKIIKAWQEEKLRDVTLDLRGTNFQKSVWNALLDIQHGKVISYGDLAKNIGKPKASRAVGSAVGENPISLIIPCHRIVQASGALGNYGWGVDLKTKILKIENAI